EPRNGVLPACSAVRTGAALPVVRPHVSPPPPGVRLPESAGFPGASGQTRAPKLSASGLEEPPEALGAGVAAVAAQAQDPQQPLKPAVAEQVNAAAEAIRTPAPALPEHLHHRPLPTGCRGPPCLPKRSSLPTCGRDLCG